MIRRQTMIYRTFNTPTLPELPRQWLIVFAVWFALVLPFGAFWVANPAQVSNALNTRVSNSQTRSINELNAASPQARINAAQTLAAMGNSTVLPKLDEMAIMDSDAGARLAAVNAANQIRTYLAQGAGASDPNNPTFALAPQDPKYIVMTDRRDVLISRDGGVTWQRQMNVLPSVASTLAVSPADKNVMFTGITDFGFYKSADGGKTWQPMNTGLAIAPGARFGITAIAVDPKNADRIFIAVGVFVGTSQVTFYPIGIMGTRDGGKTWNNIENGSQAMPIGRLLFVENVLYGESGNQVRQIHAD